MGSWLLASKQQGRLGRFVQKETSEQCFTCHGTGHFTKNCPYKGRSAPAEVQAKSLQKPTCSMSSVIGSRAVTLLI